MVGPLDVASTTPVRPSVGKVSIQTPLSRLATNKCEMCGLGQNGFSLIELVIVIVIFGIASAGLMTLFSTGIKKSADPLLQNQALQLAQEKIEIILGDRLNPARGFAYITSANYPAESPVTGFPDFSRTVTISCVTAADLNTSTGLPPPCASGYTHVTVTAAHAVLGAAAVETLVTDY